MRFEEEAPLETLDELIAIALGLEAQGDAPPEEQASAPAIPVRTQGTAPAGLLPTPPAPLATPPLGSVLPVRPAPPPDHARPIASGQREKPSAEKQRAPRAPVEAPARRAAGFTTTSGGAASAGTGQGSGTAALTGFLLLAAPGLGRRIREARGLSPRDPVRSRLERPG